MSVGGIPQPNQISVQVEEDVRTALWGRVSPEGPSYFQRLQPDPPLRVESWWNGVRSPPSGLTAPANPWQA
jgi:hypothetical protein